MMMHNQRFEPKLQICGTDDKQLQSELMVAKENLDKIQEEKNQSEKSKASLEWLRKQDAGYVASL